MNCAYCESPMTPKYRNKRFCSDKCRVYFGRENKADLGQQGETEVNVPDTTKEVSSESKKAVIEQKEGEPVFKSGIERRIWLKEQELLNSKK